MPKFNPTAKGFTLIELLVVISIIGILSSFAVVSLNSARAKARDALRKGDMAQIRTALNIYYDDNEAYPGCGTWNDTAPDFGATVNDAADGGAGCYIGALNIALTSGSRPYLGSMPKDPKNPNNLVSIDPVYAYRYVSDGTQYAIVYRVEDNTNLQVFRGW